MCLVYSRVDTAKYRKVMRGKKITVYKTYAVTAKGEIYSYFQHKPVRMTKTGIVRSNRKSVRIQKSEWVRAECWTRSSDKPAFAEVELGIHVYLQRLTYGNKHGITLAVEADVKDLVGISGDGEAVFTKIRIPPEVLKDSVKTFRKHVREMDIAYTEYQRECNAARKRGEALPIYEGMFISFFDPTGT